MITHVAGLLTINVYKMVRLCKLAGQATAVFYDRVAQSEMMPTLDVHICGTDRVTGKGIVWVHTSIYNAELIKLTRERVPEAKIIWNIHDWVPECEQYLELADVVIFPSKGYLQHCPDAKVIYRKVPKDWVKDIDLNQKRLENAMVLHSDIDPSIPYRDYRYVQEKYGNDLFIYPANSAHPEYKHVMQHLDYWSLLKELATYQYGYAGAPNQEISFDDIVTNKFWEYLAVETIPILWQAKEMQELFKNNEPVYLESEVDKLKEILKEI